MRVFVTGATGFVGTAVVRELLAVGHQVTGLARSDASAAALEAVGAEVHRGTLEDLDGLRRGAAGADGVINTAFNHDFANFADNALAERRAVEAMGEELAGSGRPFVVTAGTAGVAPGRVATERDDPDPEGPAGARLATARAALALADRGVRVSVVRLPPSVHGDADRHGFVPRLVAIARSTGLAAYPGDGSNRWAAVHQLDAAHLFRLALEDAPAGTRLHAVGDEGVPLRTIADIIGRHLRLPVQGLSAGDAAEHFGWFAPFASLDSPAASAVTRRLLDWEPTRPGLVADLEAGHYYEPVAAPA